ncbi:hypothetical protein BJ742DRAFT_740604 [Cladochytrium replicatum]|nr:hypothetical protein BJ742DRAFT_740604 [Cladochytrium replicatum]
MTTQTSAASIHEELYDQSQTAAPSRIVAIAVDASTHADYAFNFALENIVKPGDQVVLLNVRPSNQFPIYADASEWLDRAESEARTASHTLLKTHGAKLLKAGISTRAIAMVGDPRDEIVAKLLELNASLLVIGSRGISSFQRALLGSVSDFVVHHAHCPVLVVRQQ